MNLFLADHDLFKMLSVYSAGITSLSPLSMVPDAYVF